MLALCTAVVNLDGAFVELVFATRDREQLLQAEDAGAAEVGRRVLALEADIDPLGCLTVLKLLVGAQIFPKLHEISLVLCILAIERLRAQIE